MVRGHWKRGRENYTPYTEKEAARRGVRKKVKQARGQSESKQSKETQQDRKPVREVERRKSEVND